MRIYRLVAFDLDGTLVDSRRDLAESVNALLVECGGEALPEEAVGRMVGDGAAVLVTRAFAAAEKDAPPDALPRFLALYDERLLMHTRPYPGVVETLEQLQERAILAVLTNKPFAPTRAILEGLGLARFFDVERTIGGDSPFGKKPDPAGLLHLSAGAGADACQVLVVGDSLVDWRTARAAGAQACLARWGYGFEGFPLDNLTASDIAIDSPAELVHIVPPSGDVS
jgi:phosphoglycolate phosphatase